MENCPLVALYNDPHGLWPDISNELFRHLPLAKIQIKYPNTGGTPITLSDLNIIFLPVESANYKSSSIEDEVVHSTSRLNKTRKSETTTTTTTTQFEDQKINDTNSSAQNQHHHQIGEFCDSPTRSSSCQKESDVAGAAAAAAAATTTDTYPLKIPEQISLSERPYLGLYLLKTDSLESFRLSQKKLIKSWIEFCTDHHMQWLIVWVASTTGTEASSSSLANQEKLLKKLNDKLKSEIQQMQEPKTKLKDRFVRICTNERPSSSQVLRQKDGEDSSWTNCMSRIRELLAAAIENRYFLIEEEIAKQERSGATTRHDVQEKPKARYSAVFYATEELALLHVKCGRYHDALLVYEDIDLSRSPTVNPKRFRTLFKTIGFFENDDDIPTLFDFPRKSYRQLIALNRISYFDFRNYLFARQQYLLTKNGSGVECARRYFDYIRRMTTELKEPFVFHLSQSTSYRSLIWSFLASFNSAQYLMMKFCDGLKWNINLFETSTGDKHETLGKPQVITNDQLHIKKISIQICLFGLQQFTNLCAYRESKAWAPMNETTENNNDGFQNDDDKPMKSTLPPDEVLYCSRLYTKRQLYKALRSRESAYEYERVLTQFLTQQATEAGLERLASILGIMMSQWVTIKCYQYRHQRNEEFCQQEKKMTTKKLRIETQMARDSLQRSSILYRRDEWPQLFVTVRALLCEIERASGDQAKELLSCYILSNRRIDHLAFPLPFNATKQTESQQEKGRNDKFALNPKHLSFFADAIHIDSASAQNLCVIVTRGVLPSKMYFKRFLKLVSTKAPGKLTRNNDQKSSNAAPRALIPSLSSFSFLRASSFDHTIMKPMTPLVTSCSDGLLERSLEEEDPPQQQTSSLRKIASRSMGMSATEGVDKGFLRESDNKVAIQIQQRREVRMTSNDASVSESGDTRASSPFKGLSPNNDETGGTTTISIQADDTIVDDNSIQLLANPNVFIFASVEPSTQFLCSSVEASQTTYTASLDLSTSLSNVGQSLGQCQIFSLKEIDPDVLKLLVARQCICGPCLTTRPPLPNLFPSNETTAAYNAFFNGSQEIANDDFLPTTRSPESAASNLPAEKAKTGSAYVTKNSGFGLNNTSPSHSNQGRRSPIWMSQKVRTLTSSYKFDKSSIQVFPTSHRWGAKLRKLNPTIMTRSMKKQLGRQRPTGPDMKQLKISRGATMKNGPSKPSDLTQKGPKPQQSDHYDGMQSQAALQWTPRAMESGHQNTTGDQRHKSDSWLDHFNEEMSSSSLETFEDLTHRLVKSLFWSGTELGLPIPPETSLSSDIGDFFYLRLYIHSSLCRDLPVSSIIVKLTSTHHDETEDAYSRRRLSVVPSGSQNNCLFLKSFRKNDGAMIDSKATILCAVTSGTSVLTLKCPVVATGRYVVDQIHLVCKNCILTQTIGDLPPLDQMKSIFTDLLLVQKIQGNQPILRLPTPKKKQIVNQQKVNYLYGTMNSLISYGYSTKRKFTAGILSYFMRLPVLNFENPTKGTGWFPVSVTPISYLSPIWQKNFLIAGCLNFLKVKIENFKRIEPQDALKFSLIDIKNQTNSNKIRFIFGWSQSLIVSMDGEDYVLHEKFCDVTVQEAPPSHNHVEHFLILPKFKEAIEIMIPLIIVLIQPTPITTTTTTTFQRSSLSCLGLSCKCESIHLSATSSTPESRRSQRRKKQFNLKTSHVVLSTPQSSNLRKISPRKAFATPMRFKVKQQSSNASSCSYDDLIEDQSPMPNKKRNQNALWSHEFLNYQFLGIVDFDLPEPEDDVSADQDNNTSSAAALAELGFTDLGLCSAEVVVVPSNQRFPVEKRLSPHQRDASIFLAKTSEYQKMKCTSTINNYRVTTNIQLSIKELFVPFQSQKIINKTYFASFGFTYFSSADVLCTKIESINVQQKNTKFKITKIFNFNEIMDGAFSPNTPLVCEDGQTVCLLSQVIPNTSDQEMKNLLQLRLRCSINSCCKLSSSTHSCETIKMLKTYLKLAKKIFLFDQKIDSLHLPFRFDVSASTTFFDILYSVPLNLDESRQTITISVIPASRSYVTFVGSPVKLIIEFKNSSLDSVTIAHRTMFSNEVWVVLGCRCGSTQLKPNESKKVCICLVPVCSGHIRCPKIKFDQIKNGQKVKIDAIKWDVPEELLIVPTPTSQSLSFTA